MERCQYIRDAGLLLLISSNIGTRNNCVVRICGERESATIGGFVILVFLVLSIPPILYGLDWV
jgi:hypothetical protein